MTREIMTRIQLSRLKISSARNYISRQTDAVHLRSASVTAFLALRIRWIAHAWLALVGIAALLKIAGSRTPVHGVRDFAIMCLPFLLIMVAPIGGYWAASGSFPLGKATQQPQFRLAIYGRWRDVGVFEARRDPGYGPAGFMTSLLIGLMLNIPMRFLEYIAAVPAVSGDVPPWVHPIVWSMAVDVSAMSFLYAACFVMALRSIPLFPRMLAYVWLLDVVAQLCIAEFVIRKGHVPFAVAGAMQDLLTGNINKVLISIFIWLPYLLLSARVNLTYRNRVRIA